MPFDSISRITNIQIFSHVHSTVTRLQQAMSVGWLVGHTLLVRRLQAVFCITAPAQMLGLAIFITAPAHPHATSAAVYPALFSIGAQ